MVVLKLCSNESIVIVYIVCWSPPILLWANTAVSSLCILINTVLPEVQYETVDLDI